MKTTAKIIMVVFGFLFGIIVGFLYNGTYFDQRMLGNVQDFCGMTADELRRAINANPDALKMETFVSVFGVGGAWIDGTWPFWLSLALFTGFFTWLAYRLASVFIVKTA